MASIERMHEAAEIAKILPLFLSDGIFGWNPRDMEIHMWWRDLLDTFPDAEIEEYSGCPDYHPEYRFRVSSKLDGVTFFALMTAEEYDGLHGTT